MGDRHTHIRHRPIFSIFRYFLSLSEPFFREEIQSRHLKFEKLIKYIQLIKSQIKMFKQQKDVLWEIYTFHIFQISLDLFSWSFTVKVFLSIKKVS